MAVKLRLKRMGAKRKPFYRIIVADSRSPRDGRFIDMVGTYNPNLAENKYTIKEAETIEWLNKGAQPTDTVKSILTATGVWAKYKESKKTLLISVLMLFLIIVLSSIFAHTYLSISPFIYSIEVLLLYSVVLFLLLDKKIKINHFYSFHFRYHQNFK